MQEHVHLYIKNMVCPRCKTAVKAIMEANDLQVLDIQLGEVEVLANHQMDLVALDANLKAQGFELIQDRESQLVSQVKVHVLEYLKNIEFIRVKLSDYLASKMDLNYSYLSKVFSKNEANTVEHYFILIRLEKVKELLTYNELSLGEIAYQLGYSSTQALSSQFKSVLGMTVSEFKKSGTNLRNEIG